ncbi:glycosyltransferase [Methyloversatilis sp. XJ19-13]|uniref:glycosyltransferase n=1 Tax=Methyloversatilis sp. XJ19-13 TaxID=2963430 RepID=UPI00211C1DBC|nr:glycosyltransferase [Methyloversatilis sp. XJ19-13]MCQ9372921.1 glycosyltransferase [Methyloversatilis sp. XJ19-13]
MTDHPTPRTPPDASVIVCTYNRCASLADTLAALAAQDVGTGQWELLVVDNNSRDDTRSTVERFCEAHPTLDCRYLFQPAQGLSHARNLGITEARGALIVFTDDDVLPEKDWLRRAMALMHSHDCAAFGGYIAPIWEHAPPAWLTERFHGFIAIRMDTRGPFELGEADELPFGANMGFRREVFDQLGMFDTALGRKGNVLAGGEEWDLFRRVQASGGRIIYAPDIRVHHKVEAFRLRKSYFRRWRYQCSRNEALSAPLPDANLLFGVPRYLIMQLLRAAARTLSMTLSRPADEAFRQEMIIWHFMGVISGSRQMSRSRTP